MKNQPSKTPQLQKEALERGRERLLESPLKKFLEGKSEKFSLIEKVEHLRILEKT